MPVGLVELQEAGPGTLLLAVLGKGIQHLYQLVQPLSARCVEDLRRKLQRVGFFMKMRRVQY